MQEKSGVKQLAAGSYGVRIEYWEKDDYSGVIWRWKGPDSGGSKVVVPSWVLFTTQAPGSRRILKAVRPRRLQEAQLSKTVHGYLAQLTSHCPPERCVKVTKKQARRAKVVLCGGNHSGAKPP